MFAKVSFALAAVLAVSGWAACVGVAQAQEAGGTGSASGTPKQATTAQKEPAQQAKRNQAATEAEGLQHRQGAAIWIKNCAACHAEATLRVSQAELSKAHAEFWAWNYHHQVGFPEQVGTHWIGVTVVPADATLRAQLGLPGEQGLVVNNVELDSSAGQAGVAQHDVLLRLNDKPLTSPDDLRKQVDAVGEKSVVFDAIRQGKLVKVPLIPRPTARVAAKLQDAELSRRVKSRFWIGVDLAWADYTLRAQLKLPVGEGVVVNSVIDDSPAAKAGIKKHDVLLRLGDKPIPSAETFRENLQEVGEKPVAIKLIREGKTISIEVTPQKLQEPIADSRVDVLETQARLETKQTEQARRDEFQARPQLTVEVLRPAVIEGNWLLNKDTPSADPQSRLQELIAQVKQLHNALEALSVDLKKQQPPAEPGEKK